jgi:hypothetical protein
VVLPVYFDIADGLQDPPGPGVLFSGLNPSAPDEFGLGEDYRPALAPGCANALNLLQMVEQRQDVIQGRTTGATMAAPVGRAAQVYIDGYDREELRRRQAEQRSSVDQREG